MGYITQEEEEGAFELFKLDAEAAIRENKRLLELARTDPPDYAKIAEITKATLESGGCGGSEAEAVLRMIRRGEGGLLADLFESWALQVERKLSHEKIGRRIARVNLLVERAREEGPEEEDDNLIQALLDELDAAEELVHQMELEDLYREDLLRLDEIRAETAFPLAGILEDLDRIAGELEALVDDFGMDGSFWDISTEASRRIKEKSDEIVHVFETALLLDHGENTRAKTEALAKMRRSVEEWRYISVLLSADGG